MRCTRQLGQQPFVAHLHQPLGGTCSRKRRTSAVASSTSVFAGGVGEGMPEGLPFHLADYLDLVNWTGRAVRDDKCGAIAEDLPPIMERIGITRAAWLQLAEDFETLFCSWIGLAEHVERRAGSKSGVIYGSPRDARKKFVGGKKNIASIYPALG